MGDDIVERLRREWELLLPESNWRGLTEEAAAEIERWREAMDVAEDEILRLRGTLRRIAMPGVRMAYCRDGHEIAVLIARDALTTTRSSWKCPINASGCTQNCGGYGCGN